jgi:hypothetical protein
LPGNKIKAAAAKSTFLRLAIQRLFRKIDKIRGCVKRISPPPAAKYNDVLAPVF